MCAAHVDGYLWLYFILLGLMTIYLFLELCVLQLQQKTRLSVCLPPFLSFFFSFLSVYKQEKNSFAVYMLYNVSNKRNTSLNVNLKSTVI